MRIISRGNGRTHFRATPGPPPDVDDVCGSNFRSFTTMATSLVDCREDDRITETISSIINLFPTMFCTYQERV